MPNLSGAYSYVNDIEVDQDAGLTEDLFVKLGTNDNYLFDALNAEATARAAADTATRGAGPYQTLTQLKTRLDSTNRIVQIYDSGNNSVGGRISEMSGLKFNGSNDYAYVSVTTDGGNFRVESHTQTGPSDNIVRSILLDTGIPTGSGKFHELSWQSSFANMFYRIRVFEFQSV